MDSRIVSSDQDSAVQPRAPVIQEQRTNVDELAKRSSSGAELHSPKTGTMQSRNRETRVRPLNDHKPDMASIEAMRKRMTEALAQKQLKKAGNTPPTDRSRQSSVVALESSEDNLPTTSTMFSSLASGTISTDSAKTVRATPLETPGVLRTPSYPFPRMQMRLQRGISQRSGPQHKPFTLLSPTIEPPDAYHDDAVYGRHTASELSTPMGHDPSTHVLPEDPNYPTPDLYDMVLMLSTEPGLDSWWANVTEILAEAYGAERASLALPADTTDLENVPWGQRATYNLYSSDSGDSFTYEANVASDFDAKSLQKVQESLGLSTESNQTVQRPPLESRHSIAGNTPDRFGQSSQQRPGILPRAISYINTSQESVSSISARPRLTRQSPTPQSVPTLEETVTSAQRNPEVSTSHSVTPRCRVWRALQPLEAEPDALLVRTGVASLFGKRKPVILTRAYSEEHASPSRRGGSSDKRTFMGEASDDASLKSGDTFLYSSKVIRALGEFEQPEPSPWSQSPSPSPAARPDPEESPFFAPSTSASVDEDAFESDPPNYDYGASANQSLNAIGTDMSKTLVHIPLIQPVPSRSVMASGLRFPVAILSFLSTVNPYPRNLRHSLSCLLPHLAGTFSLAQQYSNLQDRLRGGPSRRSAAFGLGGTFSDEGSELELVSELRSEVFDKEKIRTSSLQGSLYSPSEGTAPSKGSTTGSLVGTPFLEHLGMNAGFPSTPGRSGSEMIDSYFSAKRNRSNHFVTTPGTVPHDEASSKSKIKEKLPRSRTASKKLSRSTRSHIELQSSASARTSSVPSEVDLGDRSGSPPIDQTDMSASRSFHRDSIIKIDNERPLPELISALMLNAVPLQLFLAKPTTGDLVWTNRKFDAFRSQGEGRVRDPWKNVHDADRASLIRNWDEALRTGSQFTHYVRVKRFNSDSDSRWFVFRASTLLSSSGRLLYWIGSFLDFHEQYMKNLEASEREASMTRDAKIRALADAIPQILFEAVEGEGIVSVNQQWHTFSGQTLEEARGLGFARHVHREDLYKCGMLSSTDARMFGQRATSESTSSSSSSQTPQQQPLHQSPRSIFTPDSNALDKMLKRGALVAETDENGRTSYSTEVRLRSKGGEFRWHLIRLVKVQAVMLNSGRASWYGTCTDIEVRMSLERDLNQANKKLNQEMESKTKFFANMSHEIRTPLNGILGSMPWLVESLLDHEQRRTVDTIQNSANNLRELVDNILDVSKVEAGKMTLLPKWFHVRSLCEEVVDTVSSRAIERGLELNYSLESTVPVTVKGDALRIRQVLLNLMGNSVKFTEQGEVYLRCHLRMADSAKDGAQQAYLAFDVIDTGRGFNELEFKRLFKQFGQIEGASQHESGSGLGLFLSKQLVEMHGGELSVQSRAGEGSTFRFYVAVELAAPGSEITSPPLKQRLSHRLSLSHGSSARIGPGDVVTAISASKTLVHTPGLSKYSSQEQQPALVSPAIASPPIISPDGSSPSARSNSGNIVFSSSVSSPAPTPESVPGPGQPKIVFTASDRQTAFESIVSNTANSRPSISEIDRKGLTTGLVHPDLYSIVVICPADHARLAIKQHIEHVVPHQIPVNVTTLPDIGAFLTLMRGPTSPTFTHIVLDVPASSDIMLFMRQIKTFTGSIVPALVIITDHYQKRDIQEDFTSLISSGRKAFLVHKPIKPSVFAMIFDPAQLRKLSKDRAREVAQTSSDDFKKIANQVKETIGNRSFRILLVEDSDVNRMVIVRYLKRVGLQSDEAKDGQECVDKVTSKGEGYYSLIICDIQMPRKNGYQACTEIRQWEAKKGQQPLPIMALTANAMPEERAVAATSGFTDYLTKPVDFNRLGRMMMGLLDSKTPYVPLKDQSIDESTPM